MVPRKPGPSPATDLDPGFRRGTNETDMPQIDQISEIFASQLFWLFITFGLVYLIIGRGMLPKISATVDARDKKISDDLEAADRARAAADETAQDMVARLSGAKVTKAQATKAVKASLANG